MRKSRVLFIALSVIGVIGLCIYFDIVNPDLQAPALSMQSGFYDEPITLSVTTNRDADIYYTLDGSEPSEEDSLYTAPILLSDPTDHPNVYSARTDISAGFFAEENRFSVPEENVDKVVVFRAFAVTKDGKQKSDITTATYVIGEPANSYRGMGVLSLVTDPDNLFDYEKGIYVSGKTFDDFVENGSRDAMSDPNNWRRWKANYTNHGMEWERPVHIDYFDADGQLILSENDGLRIKGSSSRAFTQKSFHLYARREYSGSDAFRVPFFGEYGRSRVAVFAGGQDYRTKMEDVLVSYATKDMQFEVMQNKPCIVFLDGEYWGLYYLMEEVSEAYLLEHYNLPKEDAVIIKNGAPKTFGEKTDRCIAEWQAIADDEQPLDDAGYAALCEKVDIDSYIDYYAAEIYIARDLDDWPVYNEAQWRSADDLGIEKCDGKWRWMLFDTNWACLSDWESDTIAYTMERSKLFDRLMHYKPFRKAFLSRILEMADGEFAPLNLAPEFERLQTDLKEPVVKELKKYYGDNKGAKDFEKESKSIAEFLQNRPQIIKELVKEYQTKFE